jgi:hypothetical protein
VSRGHKVAGEIASQVLDAGGLLPAGAKPPSGERVTTVVARAYRHPVLGDRVVVRLTPDSVAAGDDLEMEVLGFGAPEPRGAVGQERQRPLGFPGWALVHDPKHARYALDVVREFKKEARRAKSKPGHAKDGIDKIAERLGKSVPQFLPSFYEEAGRTFIEHGALSYAAMMFGKAREAESVHALDTDETHRAHAFLEFALAGAVTTKALAQYAKDLSDHHDAKTAYTHFRELCVKRTLGGMPPWGGMAKELRRLAKAAGEDPDDEDAAFIAEVIESPALVNAAGEFWRAYAEPIVALAARSPAIRGALLNLWPTPAQGGPEVDAEWLALLDKAGAMKALYFDGEPAEAQPAGSRAAWFDKLVGHTTRSYSHRVPPAGVFAVLRGMAPRLAADGNPITCARRWGLIDVDLCELALELGIPVKTEGRGRIDLEEWAKEASAPERGRDPVRVAAHAALAPLVIKSVSTEIGKEPFDTVARGKAGLAAAKRAWLEGVIAAAEVGGLPAIEAALETIDKRVSAATFAELPDLHARLAAIDVAPALARTLRGGIIDELGWPALEAAVAELDPDGKGNVTLTGAAPAVIATNGLRAIAIGPTGRLGEHDLRLPAKAELHACRWIGDQLLVLFRHDHKSFAYWSGAPNDLIAIEGYFYSFPVLMTCAVVLPDGAVSEGARAVRAGDRSIPLERSAPYADGTTIWRTEWKDGEHRLREVSADTGDLGRVSWPAFLEAYIADGWKLNLAACYLVPAPGVASPLGHRDGMIGVRTRQPSDPLTSTVQWQLETIDGAKWEGGAAGGYPVELLALPGDPRRRPVLHESRWRSSGTAWIVDPDGVHKACRVDASAPGYTRGQAIILPVQLWHYLSPRDPAGSGTLRGTTDEQARALIGSVETGDSKSDELPKDLAAPDAVVTARLRVISDARLRKGIAGLAGLARRFEVVRDELVKTRDPSLATKLTSTAKLDDDQLRAVLAGGYRWGRSAGSVAAQIATVCAALLDEAAGDRVIDEIPASELEWAEWAIAPGALVFAAQAFGIEAPQRQELARLLQLLVDAGWFRLLPAMRMWTGSGELGIPGDPHHAVVVRGANRYFTWKRWTYRTGNEYLVVEHAPGGAWKPLGAATIKAERRAIAMPEDTVRGFLQRLAGGPPAWSAEAAAAIASGTGLTSGEAALAWAGFPRLMDSSAAFLDKDIREAMDLKQQQAGAARDNLRAVPIAKRVEILAAAASDPAALWDPVAGGAADRMAGAWNRLVGRRTPIPDEVLVAADRDLRTPMQPGAALVMLANPQAAPQLTTDGAWWFDHTGTLVRRSPTSTSEAATAAAAAAAPVAELPVFHTAAVYLPYLFAALPVGDAFRAQLPVAYQLVQDRLDNPELLMLQASNTHHGDDAEKNIAAALAMFEGDDLPAPLIGRNGKGGVLIRSDKSVILFLRPAELHTASELARMRLYTQHYQRWGVGTRDVIAYLRSDELARMMARVTDTPVPPGGWEQNPLASAPELVAKVKKKKKVSEDAAALYLQMLTLLWPTPKNVQTWNDWTPATYKKAAAELADAELILEAKRERAQRSFFLPGGWEALKAPHPPMETWKVPLYTTERTETGDPRPRFERFFAFDAPHVLFETAWARVEAGDPPRYEEVVKR